MNINREINNGNMGGISAYNPVKDTWLVTWNVDNYQYELIFEGKPAIEEIKKVITEHLNTLCNDEIFKGFKFDNNVVWLSQENQQNYLRDLNLAKISDGANLPIKYKFGEDISIYKSFVTVEELQDFNIQVANHINITINKYWELKDSIDWSDYENG